MRLFNAPVRQSGWWFHPRAERLASSADRLAPVCRFDNYYWASYTGRHHGGCSSARRNLIKAAAGGGSLTRRFSVSSGNCQS